MTDQQLDILLVEDNALDVELMEIALRKNALSYVLNVCEDGEKAMQYLHKQDPYQNARQPDLILLDLNLPKKTGYEILDELKKEPSLEAIPVIVLTTTAQQKDIQRISTYRGTQFFTKPTRFVDYKDVVQSIRDCFLSIQQKADGNNVRSL
jgi:CheY-like chemotaxis protein